MGRQPHAFKLHSLSSSASPSTCVATKLTCDLVRAACIVMLPSDQPAALRTFVAVCTADPATQCTAMALMSRNIFGAADARMPVHAGTALDGAASDVLLRGQARGQVIHATVHALRAAARLGCSPASHQSLW